MSDLYRLDFSSQIFPVKQNALIYRINTKTAQNPTQFYTFSNNNLAKYEFNGNAASWQTKWSKSLETDDPTRNRILHFPTFKNTDNIVMVKTSKGINFYQIQNDDFNLILKSDDYEENTFHDAFRWNEPNNVIKIGNFYRNETVLGILTKHEDYGLQFYVIKKDALSSKSYPIWSVQTDLSPIGNYSSSDFFLADITNKRQQNIIIRNKNGLNVYEFDENYDIKPTTVQIANGAKSDDTEQNLFFPNLTGRSFRDIVVFNKTGMFIYQYDNLRGNYAVSHYNSLFSEIKGWTNEHVRSVMFEDINSDGFEEMIFTGPRGIDILSFDRDNNQWLSSLDDNQITISERYGKIKTILPAHSTNNPMLFTYADQLHWANITTIKNQYELKEASIPKRNASTPSSLQQFIPQVVENRLIEEKPVRLLRDDLDCSSILNAVDKSTGKVHFQLPLIDLTTAFSNDIKLNFIYNGVSQESTILGIGWSGLPRDFITMDHQSSIYEDSELYYVVSDGLPTELKLDSTNSNSTTYSFKVSNNATSETQIRYYKNEEKWEIKKSNTIKIYGRSGVSSAKDPIEWEIVWENWRGAGSSSTGQLKIPSSWYLTEIRDENKVVKLTYDIFDQTIPGSTNSFTREIYIKTISSQTCKNLNKNEITFDYSGKDIKEYDAPAVVDKNGFIKQQLITSRYLKGYTVATQNYHQKINFIYNTINGKRLLTEIRQENDPTSKPILRFDYKPVSNSYLMEKATLPSEARVEFSYEPIGEISRIDEQLGDVRLDLPANSKVDFTNGDIIVSSMKAGEIILRTFKQDTTGDRSVSIIQPYFGRNIAKNYETLPAQNYFALIVHYTSEKELYFLNKPDKTWTKTSEFIFQKDAQIKFGKDFVLAFERNSPIEIITWNKESKTWQKQAFKTDFLADSDPKNLPQVTIFDSTFVVYNNDIFWIAFRDRNQKWRSKKIKEMPKAMDCIKTTVDKFNIDNDQSKYLLNHFEQDALQVYNNLFSLSRWCIKGSQLYTMLDLFVLNKSYEFVRQQQFNIPHEDLSKIEVIREQQFTLSEGNPTHSIEKIYKLKLGYDVSGDRFKIILKDFPKSFLDDIRKDVENQLSGAPKQEIEKVIEGQKAEFRKQCEKLFEKDFLLTLSQYVSVLNSQTVTIGNNAFTFTGVEWKEDQSMMKTKKERNFLVLGEKYILAKENENSSIKLYEGTNEKKHDRSLVNLSIPDFNDVYNAYPIFLAYQEKSTATSKVIKFSKNGDFDKLITLPRDEQLNPSSNHQMLISNIGNSTLVFRQMLGFNQLLPNQVITKVSSYFDKNDKRSTGYEYKSPRFLNNVIYYQELSIIPGNDKSSFGWITEEKYFDKPSEAQKIKYFNGKGTLIKTSPLIPEQNEAKNTTSVDQGNLYSNATIFDATGKLKVAEFFTNDISDEEVGYYGFEDYEENRIGLKSLAQKWVFEENNVVKNGFSFTGQNYLKLSKSILYGTFKPKQQDQDYIASCWIRPHTETFTESPIAPLLTVNVQLENNGEIYEYTRLGDIKYQVGNWYYVEVLVDFASARDMPKFNTKSITAPVQNNELKATIVVRPSKNSNVDVDHIRFSPLNSPFKATVYNINTMQIKDEIRQDGLIKIHIYDKHNKEIASIDEYGQLKEFKTYTKASSIGKIVQLNSITQIESETGFYESFAPSSFESRWKIDISEAWQISPNQLSHLTSNEDNLSLNISEMDSKSYGMRMYLTLNNKQDSFLKFGNGVALKSNGNSTEFAFLDTKSPMPLSSEIIIILENTRLLIWIDGGLYYEGISKDSSINSIKVSGEVKLNDVIVFNKPSIQTIYSNLLQEKLQKIKLENENTAIIREYLYDELGRQTINVQPARIIRSSGQSLLAHQPNFVTNKNPYSENSVWKTGLLKGESKDILGEYGYSQTKYYDNPLNDKSLTGLPGKEFSISGPYAKRFTPFSDNTYINNVYPVNRNYTHQVEYKPGEVKYIIVLDKKKNKVAKYIEILNSGDVLSTYEYDSKGNVIKILPPLYHEKAQSLLQMFSSSSKNVTVERDSLQKSLGIFMTYNKNDDILTKETPDTQKIEHIYDDDLLKFTIFYNRTDHPENIMYFDYDEFGRLYERGELTHQYSRQELFNLTLTQSNTRVYQQFSYNDFERDPILRRKTKRAITYNKGNPVIEEFIFTTDEKTLSKRVLLPVEGSLSPQIMEVNKLYVSGKLKEIEYPVDIQDKPLKLTYKYNKLGQMVAIGVPENENLFAQFTYNPAGQITSEEHAPNSEKIFTRHYNYNSAGFLTRIHDKFLTEDISYTEKSYGGMGYGDGTITSTKFEAKWHTTEYCNTENLHLNKYSFIGPGVTESDSELCFNKLKETEYLDSNYHQAKVFYPKLNQELPNVCTYGVGSYHIQKTLGTKGFPSHYGHSYDYGNHQELTKAKYFVGKEIPQPLQPDTFSKEIPSFNSTTSRDIWRTLHTAGYIIQNNEKADFSYSHGKPGKSIIRSSLFEDLGNISVDYRSYQQPLQRIIVSCLAEKQKPSQIKATLKNAISKWISFKDETSIKQVTDKILNMLEKKSYLINPFTDEFNNILRNYQSWIPEIVRVLQDHFGNQLGEAEYDVESYDIDANGNHKLFYTGFDRYQLEYKDNTNQISNIKYTSFSSIEGFKNFRIEHDNRGNIIQALHKGIQRIEYHPVSNRPIKMKLVDGRSLLFQYDMQGERILKRVIDNTGETIYEIHYIRDESGKTLVERKLTYTLPNLPPDVLITTYIYGPRGLVGFYRHDEFYSVFADHEGSIRLIIKGDEVVAAYDYLPYGNIMRKYGNDPESHIPYLYTGQEFDEETSLYNLHARVYDPSIGRFYQLDPKEQYFSSYKYAGNSPVSMIDPNGEWAIFAFFAAIFKVITTVVSFIAPIIYGYIGGVKANNNQLNPLKWDFSKASTWKGIVGGVKRGTELGAQITANPSTVTSSFKNAYKAVSAVNKNSDPSKWRFDANTVITAAEGFAEPYENPKKISSGSSSDNAKIDSKIFTQNGLATDSDLSESKTIYNGLLNEVKLNSELPKSVKIISNMLSTTSEDPVKRIISDITGATQPIPETNRNLKKSNTHQRKRRSVEQKWEKIVVSNEDKSDEDSSLAGNPKIRIHENQTKEKKVRRPRSIDVLKNHDVHQHGEVDAQSGLKTETKLSTLKMTNLNSHKPKLISSDATFSDKGQPSNTDLQLETSFEALDTYKALQFVARFMEQYRQELENFDQNSWNFKYYNEKILEKLKTKSIPTKVIWADVSKNEAVAALLGNRSSDTTLYYHETKYDYVFLKDTSNLNGRKAINSTEGNHLESNAPISSTRRSELFSEKSLVKAFTRSSKDISYIATYHVPQLNFCQPIPHDFEANAIHGCHQCKYTSYGVLTVADFGPIDKIFQISERQKMLPLSSRNSKITTFRDLVGSNYLSEKKRQKRSIFNQDDDYSSFSNETNAGNTDLSIHLKKTDSISNSYDESNTSSSWMNWFTWLKNSINDVFYTTDEVPNNTSSNFTISQIGAQFDTNGTILLLDLLVRKATGRKFVPLKDNDELSLLQIQGDAVNITSEFEDILTKAAMKSGIPPENLTFDPIKVQEIIIDQLRKSKFSKISETLYSYARKANPDCTHNDILLINLKQLLKKSFDMKYNPKRTPIQQKHHIPDEIKNSNLNFMKVSDTMTQRLLNKSDRILIN